MTNNAVEMIHCRELGDDLVEVASSPEIVAINAYFDRDDPVYTSVFYMGERCSIVKGTTLTIKRRCGAWQKARVVSVSNANDKQSEMLLTLVGLTLRGSQSGIVNNNGYKELMDKW